MVLYTGLQQLLAGRPDCGYISGYVYSDNGNFTAALFSIFGKIDIITFGNLGGDGYIEFGPDDIPDVGISGATGYYDFGASGVFVFGIPWALGILRLRHLRARSLRRRGLRSSGPYARPRSPRRPSGRGGLLQAYRRRHRRPQGGRGRMHASPLGSSWVARGSRVRGTRPDSAPAHRAHFSNWSTARFSTSATKGSACVSRSGWGRDTYGWRTLAFRAPLGLQHARLAVIVHLGTFRAWIVLGGKATG